MRIPLSDCLSKAVHRIIVCVFLLWESASIINPTSVSQTPYRHTMPACFSRSSFFPCLSPPLVKRHHAPQKQLDVLKSRTEDEDVIISIWNGEKEPCCRLLLQTSANKKPCVLPPSLHAHVIDIKSICFPPHHPPIYINTVMHAFKTKYAINQTLLLLLLFT